MKSIEDLKAQAKGAMNEQQLILDIPLREKGQYFGRETSIARAPFPENVESKGKIKMLTKNPQMLKAMTSVMKSAQLTKKMTLKKEESRISQSDFDEMMRVLDQCGIDKVGHVTITEKDVFKDLGIPYRHIIVFLAHQENEPIMTSPSLASQGEVGRVYGVTGIAANKISVMLDKKGYGTMPAHSLGGSVDYTKLGWMAGLGEIGRHGLLIEPGSGPNHRLGAIYSNIENLDDFFDDKEDHSWVSDFCAKCGKCIRKCPGEAILDHPVTNENGHTTSIEYIKCHPEFANKWGCNICVKECPFTTVGYEKLKKTAVRKK